MSEMKLTFKTPDEIVEFVNTVSKYEFDVDVRRGRVVVDAKSLLGIMHLGLNSILELKMHTADGEELEISGYRIFREGNQVCTDRSRVYPGFAGAHLRSETPELRDGCHLEVIVDEHFIEVFVNDGEYVISNAVYGLKKEIRYQGSGEAELWVAG